MKLCQLVILLFLLLISRVTAQPSETTYLGSVIKEGSADDESFGPFNIGFDFTFFGNSYNQFYVSSNGLVLFGAGSTDGTEDPIPTAGAPNNFIAALWDNLTISSTGKMLYATIGAAPNRKLIIQGTNMGFYPVPIFMGTYLVILYETSNKIQVQYRIIVDATSARAHGSSATIGLENSDGTAGVEYAYHNPAAISTGQAISFTPSGPSYTPNSNEIYDGVVLTTNLTLPEPGIPLLLSPPQDAVIGSDYSFEWAESAHAASYTLLISHFSDLGGATSYSAGSNLTYDITGLTLDDTYYWGVFATNATGTTWCEIKKFTTSSDPPLAAVPQTIYVEQSQEKTTKLQYTGGDESAKTAIITSLPGQGQLYQYNAGVKGDLISSVPTTVTDAGRNVIYLANGSSGNGAGNFSYEMHDDTGYSPDALVTVNVSPPGIPNLLYTAKNTNIELQFDRTMADPGGKQSQFAVTVNGAPAAINSLSLKPGDTYSIIVTLNTPLAGTETVLISYTAGDVASTQGGWLASFTSQPVTLTAQTITFSQSLSKKYSDSPLALTAYASSGLVMTYSSSNPGVATATNSTLTFHALGTSDITARQAGNVTYAPAKYIKTLSVAKGDQTISFSVLPAMTYGDPDYTPAVSASSGLSVSLASDNTAVATIVSGKIHIVGTGTAIITASQSGNSLWNPATDVPRTLIVSKANQTITFSVLPSKTFGDPDFSPSASSSSGLSVSLSSDNPAVATIVSNMIHITGTGTALITASQAGDANYNAATDIPQTLTVIKANQTITFNALPAKVFGDADFDPGASASSGLTISYSSDNPAVATIAGGLIHITGAGTAIIKASQAGDANYNAAPDVPQTLTVNKANQTITFNALPSKVLGDADFDPGVSASSGLTVSYSSDSPGVATIINGMIHITGAGITIITASQSGNTNYNPASDVQHILTINNADQTITFGVLPDKTFGDPDFLPSASSSSGLSVSFSSDNPAVATIVNGMIHITGAGSAVITASQAGNTDYSAAADVPQTLVVNKANQTITFNALPVKVFGDVYFNPGATASSGLTVSYSRDNQVVTTIVGGLIYITGAGSAVITASQAGDANFNPAPDVLQTLTVNKANQIIAFNALPVKIFGDAVFNPGASTSSALTVNFSSDNSAVAIIVGGMIYITGAGTAVITASQTGNGNYNPAPVVLQTLTVNKGNLNFTADNISKEFQAQNPVLTYLISGFVNGETQSILDALPTIQTTAVQNSPVGSYPITITGGSDNNYNYSYIPGTLTVTKIPQTITFTDIVEKLLVDESYTLVATSTSGFAVLFESMDTQKATVSGDKLTGVSKGTVQIRAYNPGDENYDPAEAFATVEIYSTHKDIMHLFTPNNDGFNDLWELPDLATWGKCDVKVYNRWGKLVFADADYNNQWDGTSNGSPLPEGPYYFVIKTENAGMIKGTVNIVR